MFDRVRGLITSRDLLRKEVNVNAVVDHEGRLLVGGAVGVKDGCGFIFSALTYS